MLCMNRFMLTPRLYENTMKYFTIIDDDKCVKLHWTYRGSNMYQFLVILSREISFKWNVVGQYKIIS